MASRGLYETVGGSRNFVAARARACHGHVWTAPALRGIHERRVEWFVMAKPPNWRRSRACIVVVPVQTFWRWAPRLAPASLDPELVHLDVPRTDRRGHGAEQHAAEAEDRQHSGPLPARPVNRLKPALDAAIETVVL